MMDESFHKFLNDTLDKVEHTSIVDEFYQHFETIRSLVSLAQPWLSEVYFASRFIYGLRDDIQNYVIHCHPITILDAFEVACVSEYNFANSSIIQNVSHVIDIVPEEQMGIIEAKFAKADQCDIGLLPTTDDGHMIPEVAQNMEFAYRSQNMEFAYRSDEDNSSTIRSLASKEGIPAGTIASSSVVNLEIYHVDSTVTTVKAIPLTHSIQASFCRYLHDKENADTIQDGVLNNGYVANSGSNSVEESAVDTIDVGVAVDSRRLDTLYSIVTSAIQRIYIDSSNMVHRKSVSSLDGIIELGTPKVEALPFDHSVDYPGMLHDNWVSDSVLVPCKSWHKIIYLKVGCFWKNLCPNCLEATEILLEFFNIHSMMGHLGLL